MKGDDITVDWLRATLGGDIDAIETERIGDGHIGVNVRVRLIGHDGGLPDSVVLKMPATDEASLTAAKMLRHYEREVRFYQEIAATVDIRVPRCHHAEWDPATNDFVIVLEDMAPARQGDQLTGCRLDQAHDAVRELTKLHGPRWDDPTLDDVDWMDHAGKGDDEAGAGLAMMWQMFWPAFLEGHRRHLAADEVELGDVFGQRLTEWRAGRAGPLAVTHGDYRLDNMLFGTDAGGPKVTVVDWQSPAHGTPITDLSYFCSAGLLPPDRREHERDLVATYAEALAEYGIDLDDDWLWTQYRRDPFAGLVTAVVASQIVTLNDRSEAMFGAMASRALRMAIDLDSLSTF